jgi:hypothetical protein
MRGGGSVSKSGSSLYCGRQGQGAHGCGFGWSAGRIGVIEAGYGRLGLAGAGLDPAVIAAERFQVAALAFHPLDGLFLVATGVLEGCVEEGSFAGLEDPLVAREDPPVEDEFAKLGIRDGG